MTLVTGAAHGSAALAVGAPKASANSSVRAPAAATSKRPTGAAPLSAPAQNFPMASSFPWGSVSPPSERSSAVDGESNSAPKQVARSARANGVRYGDGVFMRRPVLQSNWRQVPSAARALAPGTGSRVTTSSEGPRRRLSGTVTAMSTPGGDVPPVTKGASRERPSAPRRALPGTRWAGWPAVVLGVLFVAVTVLVVTGATQCLDEWMIRSVRPNDVWGDSQVRFSPWVHRLRPTLMLLLLAATCVAVSARRRSWHPAVIGFLLACVSTGFLLLVKFSLGRPDPHGALAASGGSYPSGHMMAVVVCMGGCGLLMGPGLRWRWVVLAAPAGLMAASLVISATHWPTDVVGGALLGLAGLTAADWGRGHAEELQQLGRHDVGVILAPERLARSDATSLELGRVVHERDEDPGCPSGSSIGQNLPWSGSRRSRQGPGRAGHHREAGRHRLHDRQGGRLRVRRMDIGPVTRRRRSCTSARNPRRCTCPRRPSSSTRASSGARSDTLTEHVEGVRASGPFRRGQDAEQVAVVLDGLEVARPSPGRRRRVPGAPRAVRLTKFGITACRTLPASGSHSSERRARPGRHEHQPVDPWHDGALGVADPPVHLPVPGDLALVRPLVGLRDAEVHREHDLLVRPGPGVQGRPWPTPGTGRRPRTALCGERRAQGRPQDVLVRRAVPPARCAGPKVRSRPTRPRTAARRAGARHRPPDRAQVWGVTSSRGSPPRSGRSRSWRTWVCTPVIPRSRATIAMMTGSCAPGPGPESSAQPQMSRWTLKITRDPKGSILIGSSFIGARAARARPPGARPGTRRARSRRRRRR